MNGEKRALMESTSHYWRKPAMCLFDEGIDVCVLNAILIHRYGINTIREVKTDKADAKKIAMYALNYWNEIRLFSPEDKIREMLKTQARLYMRVSDLCASMRNNLVSLCDQVNPGINHFYGQTELNDKGHYKWIDFLQEFWHRNYITEKGLDRFDSAYKKWCLKNNYAYKRVMSERIFNHALNEIATYSYDKETKLLVRQTTETLTALYENLYAIKKEINRLAMLLPEYEIVMNMDGCGQVIGPLIMAEIGDITRFKNKKALIAYAGLDSKPYQSGLYEAKSRHITKKGSAALRRNVYTAVQMIYINKREGNPIYDFMIKKKEEGKHYYVCIVAGCSKFLKVYYGTVKKVIEKSKET